MPGSGTQAGGAPGGYLPPAAAYLPPAALAAGATPMAPPAAYPAPVYGAPPPPPPAPPGAGLPVGLPAGSPVPAHNPYAPPPRGGARPTYGPPSGTAQPAYGQPSAQPAYGPPGPGGVASSAGVPGAPPSSVPRADPGARYLDAAAPPAVPHSYAEQYGYGYDTDAPPWAGGVAAGPVGSGMSIAAFVLAAIALFVLPPFFGAAAIVMAAFAIRRGERLGRASLITSILCLAGGVTLGVLTYTASIPGF